MADRTVTEHRCVGGFFEHLDPKRLGGGIGDDGAEEEAHEGFAHSAPRIARTEVVGQPG